MDRESIIRMARDAGGMDGWGNHKPADPELRANDFVFDSEDLQRFFALAYAAGAAAKREECAKVCDDLQSEMVEQGIASPYGDRFADAIRARGEK
jgi:hypothetical protein